MKNNKIPFILGMAAWIFSCHTAPQDPWQDRASALMAAGELAKAELLLDSVKNAGGETVLWQADSLKEIISRIREEFRIDEQSAVESIFKRIPGADPAKIKIWEDGKFLEYRVIDGEKKYFFKAVGNLILTAPDLQWLMDSLQMRSDSRVEVTVPNSTAIIEASKKTGMGTPVKPVGISIDYTVTVKPNVVPAGHTIRCWMPFPQENERQTDVLLTGTEPSRFVVAPNGSPHRTVYMEKTAVQDSATVFNVNFTYTAHGIYFPAGEMEAKLQPYDKDSELYKTYTSQRKPHIVFSDRIARKAKEIVGDETDPIRKTALIYDWIDATFPWAGALQYGIIPNIPEYVMDIGHGDCGQVTLLLIAMLRSQGIPAKWESGWMLHPGSVNLHDWGAVYYEGIGWVPVDMSFGNQPSGDPAVKNFFKSGIDSYRLIVNDDYGQELIPGKVHLRSDPVDFQMGELEWEGKNLYYPDWTKKMEVKYSKK